MDFKNIFSKSMLMPLVVVIFLIGFILWNVFSKAASPDQEEGGVVPQVESVKEIPDKLPDQNLPESGSTLEDAAIQEQLDRDRREQKQTKYLKTKLEQTNLELDQEKALAEINKLRMENTGGLKDQDSDGQKSIPEVRVEYIGGDNAKKEAILSIAGVSFQVREKSNPTDTIKVLTISDSSVTLQFSTPEQLTKTIEYKPE